MGQFCIASYNGCEYHKKNGERGASSVIMGMPFSPTFCRVGVEPPHFLTPRPEPCTGLKYIISASPLPTFYTPAWECCKSAVAQRNHFTHTPSHTHNVQTQLKLRLLHVRIHEYSLVEQKSRVLDIELENKQQKQTKESNKVTLQCIKNLPLRFWLSERTHNKREEVHSYVDRNSYPMVNNA